MAPSALSTAKISVSSPFHMASPQRITVNGSLPPAAASSSRSQQPSTSSNLSNLPGSLEVPLHHRIRLSLGQTLRTATRSKKLPPPPVDEYGTITAKPSKGKEKAVNEDPPKEKEKEKEKSTMLGRFRRNKDPTSSPVPAPPSPGPSKTKAGGKTDQVRGAGFATMNRQGSMSSPALHLSSQALPSPKSQSAIPVSSSSSSAALVSPTRERTRRSSLQRPQVDVSAAAPLLPKRDPRGNGHAVFASQQTSREPTISRHRATQSNPAVLPSSPSTPTLPWTQRGLHISTDLPPRRTRDQSSPPTTPTPMSGSRGQLARGSSGNAGFGSGHLPLHTPPQSPTPRGLSPAGARPPTARPRVVTPTQRGFSSSSTSHLPLTRSSPSPTPRRPSIDSPRRPSVDSPRRPSVDSPRRPSIDSPRRPSVDAPRRPSIDSPRRPSVDAPRRPSVDAPRPSMDSPRRPSVDSRRQPSNDSGDRGTPSPVRPRPISPGQRSYSQNRHFNISTTSLSSPPNPEHREIIRTATSMLCKELVKPAMHMGRTESAMREWEEVEVRTQRLVRLEKMWGKSGSAGNASSSNLNTVGGLTSSGLSAAAEERERRLFCETLRDGFVLCQMMNRLRSSSIVRPDMREDGFVRTSNITKFLAACASYGLPHEDLFQGDDLIEPTSESLARVAKTIIALIKFVEAPYVDRSRYAAGLDRNIGPSLPSSPYSQGTNSRATASTPNLNIQQLQQRSVSPTPAPTSPTRKRWSPPTALPTVRSNSPGEGNNSSSGKTAQNVNGRHEPALHIHINAPELKDVPKIMSPPPRSPRRPKPVEGQGPGLFSWAMNVVSPSRSSVADSTRASVGDASFRGSVADNTRQSMASSAITDTTVTTSYSSLLEVGRTNSNTNKFATIRTITTDATSEVPSISRAEGSSINDEMARKRGMEPSVKHTRDRRSSEGHVVDLSRVAEETEESGSSSKGHERDKGKGKTKEQEKTPALYLRMGVRPDDFFDATQAHSQTRPIPIKPRLPEQDEGLFTHSPVSVTPPRKLAIVGASRHNDSLESLSPFPRRPTHHARHSIDAPVLLPKEPSLSRDVSPDGISLRSSNVMIRRQSSKLTAVQRPGPYVRQNGYDDNRDTNDSPVPFPRTVSGERVPSPHSSSSDDPSAKDKPRQPRGRFQSDVDISSSRRRGRPSSYDESGAKPTRSRFESMVNLGGASGRTSASDLLSRDSLDGSVVRKPLIIREEGKPPTHFQLGNCIGRGQFGSVYRALNLNTGQMVAVKRIRLEGLKEDEVTTLMREVDLVKSLSHPSIVKYEGMARDDDTLSIVLEYAENGSLGQILKAFGKLNERLVAGYVVKILEGLHYLHQSDVVHCDLKAANILTTKTGNVKLSDFGVSLNLRAMQRENKDVAGTPNWMAPEVIELKGASTKADIWSLACTVVELLTGRPPYAEKANGMSVMYSIVEDDQPPIPEGCSPLLQDFLAQCFNKDPTKRPSADVLCEHPWLKKNWGAHKELRPQDSIPFLRRVSADLQKSEAVRVLSQIEMPETPLSESPQRDDVMVGTPPGRRFSNSSTRPPPDNDISPREHSFVKTTFSKPMVCRVCLLTVKRTAVLCAQCSLISHSKCAINAPPTCDLRAQLLLYAQYAEKGNPGSVYSNPMDLLNDAYPTTPISDGSYVTPNPGSSQDIVLSQPPPSPSSPVHPPTAFKFMAAFRRSRSTLSTEPGQPSSSSSSSLGQGNAQNGKVRQGKSVPRKDMKERPQSLASNNTTPNTSSLRSAATAAESFSSRRDGRKSAASANGTETGTRMSRFSAIGDSEIDMSSKITSLSGGSVAATDHNHDTTGIPGGMPPETRRLKRRDRENKSSNCTVQ